MQNNPLAKYYLNQNSFSNPQITILSDELYFHSHSPLQKNMVTMWADSVSSSLRHIDICKNHAHHHCKHFRIIYKCYNLENIRRQRAITTRPRCFHCLPHFIGKWQNAVRGGQLIEIAIRKNRILIYNLYSYAVWLSLCVFGDKTWLYISKNSLLHSIGYIELILVLPNCATLL